MHFNLLSLFPLLLKDFLSYAIINRSIVDKKISVDVIDIREKGIGRNKRVDDKIYGGGAGMLMRPDPVVDSIESLEDKKKGKVFLLCPSGMQFNQKLAWEWLNISAITLICGRYEGFDSRIDKYVDNKISIGPFVIMGGEVAAMAILESVIRLIPGVLGNEKSLEDETTEKSNEYPQFTKPFDFRGEKVPDVLLSGNTKLINSWNEKNKYYKK